MQGDTTQHCRDAKRWQTLSDTGLLGLTRRLHGRAALEGVITPGEEWAFFLFSDILVYGERKTRTKFGTQRVRGGAAYYHYGTLRLDSLRVQDLPQNFRRSRRLGDRGASSAAGAHHAFAVTSANASEEVDGFHRTQRFLHIYM